MVAYQHVTWLYACRFLRVSMDLEMSSTHGFNRVLQSLNGIVKMAKERHDDSILLITSTMQAHIRLLSGGQDAMEQAQRHLATAQSLQLSAAASRLPQLIAFIRVLDLTCSILGSDVRQTKSKMRESLLQLEQMLNSPEWSDDGIIHLPLNPGPTPPATFSCTGAVSSGAYGPNILTLSWLSKHDMRMLVYYLCGVAATPANPAEMDQAEQFFTQALQLEHAENTNLPHSLSSIDTSHEWRRTLGAYIKIHLALLLCSRTQWKRASGIMEELTTHQNHGLPPTEPLTTLTRYLEGVISQGLGDTSTALRSFTLSIFNPHLDFCQAPTTSTQRIQRDLTILATLNRILIERSIPGNESKITSLINTIEPLCMAINSNKHLRSALSFIKVCSQGTQLSVIETKKHLEEALTMARDLSNTQLVSLSMSFLNWKFLRGMVGPQAEKGARAAVMTATNAGNQLWVSVSKGTLAESLELQGKVDEAKTVKEEAVELARICTPGFF
ncbi:MAG: imidazoleglycerol-phosphate dehydratase [Watsoniomyces obsoletus]|nr:MAG: imidazoleglycerol-phosphate dehydratase [Watsoniomyces obsoletus]